MARILVVDDESAICWGLRESLGDEGHDVSVAASAEEALSTLNGNGPPEAILLDVRLPGMDGLAAMREFRARLDSVPIVLMTAFGDLDTAVKAVQQGAFEYLVKPFDLDRATDAVNRALASTAAAPAPDAVREAAAETDALVGSSPAMQEVFKQIALVAASDVPVLITGESGTGKELVARAIHRHGARRDGPFLPICLAALSSGLVESELFGHVQGAFTGAARDRQGLLELAAGGTVLLDEIGDTEAGLQVKLLRALEQREITPVGDPRPRPFDARIVAATNRELPELIAAERFREDLYFRLSVFRIHLPPLRERPEDVPRLAEHFLRRVLPAGREPRISEAAMQELQSRPWAGNVRELRNVVEHAAIVSRGAVIEPAHLPQPSRSPVSQFVGTERNVDESIGEWTRSAIDADAHGGLFERFLSVCEPPLLRSVLDHTGGNKAAAAELLGMHRATLRQKLRKHGIE